MMQRLLVALQLVEAASRSRERELCRQVLMKEIRQVAAPALLVKRAAVRKEAEPGEPPPRRKRSELIMTPWLAGSGPAR